MALNFNRLIIWAKNLVVEGNKWIRGLRLFNQRLGNSRSVRLLSLAMFGMMTVLLLLPAMAEEDYDTRQLRKIIRLEPTSSVRYDTWKTNPAIAAEILKAVSCYHSDDDQKRKEFDEQVDKGNEAFRFVWFCQPDRLAFTQIRNNYEFKKEIILRWTTDDPHRWGDDLFWVAPVARMSNIGNCQSPIIHSAAEVPSDRVKFVRYLRKYYLSVRKKPEIWKDIINSKNTMGHTFLDYIEYLHKEGKIIDGEKEACEELKKILINDGAIYSQFAPR